MHTLTRLSALTLVAMALAGCARNEAAPLNQAPPPQVSVAAALSRPVAEFEQFSGRIAAVEQVEIRPRVSGYIASVNFTQGREVRKGEVLFTIDPRPYEAELKRTRAELARAKTALVLAQSERERAVKLLDAHAISQEEFDKRASGSEQAQANAQAAEAAMDAAALNLDFTRIEAPISGVVSKAEITQGNLVAAGQTVLTSVVSIDPVYVEFDGDEGLYSKYAQLERPGGRASERDQGSPLWIGLTNESGHPHQGRLVFLDNQLNPATGTLHARGLLENHERIFTPGMFARVKLTGNDEHDAVLVKDSAVGTDQSVKYVFVVSEQGVVEYRAVKLGPVIDDLRVIREGLRAGELVIVNGLQRVRPGMPVATERVAMQATPPLVQLAQSSGARL